MGIPLKYVTIVGYGTQPRPHTQPVDVTAGTYGQNVLVRVCGVIAGWWFNRQILSDPGIIELLVGSPDDQFELTGMLSGRKTRLPRAPWVAPGEDLASPARKGVGSHLRLPARLCSGVSVRASPLLSLLQSRR